MTYNEVPNHIENTERQTEGIYWKYRKIIGHQHTPVGHKDRNGSKHNVDIEWETGEITTEPLAFVAEDAAVDLALYAKEHDLLENPRWKRFRNLAKTEKKILRLVKQAKLRSFRIAPKFKYGLKFPEIIMRQWSLIEGMVTIIGRMLANSRCLN